MLNKKIKSSILLLFLLTIFFSFTPISANEIKANDYSLIFKEINGGLFANDEIVIRNHISNDSLKELLRITHANEDKKIKNLTLIDVNKLNDSYDLLKVNKQYDAKIDYLYVLYNKEKMKFESFNKNISLFIDSYKNNQIDNKDLIVDVYTYLLYIDEISYASEMMINPKDINIVYDGKNSKIKYSLRNKYNKENSNNHLYHYYAQGNGVSGMYKYFVLVKKDNLFKIDVNNISSYLYILKDDVENGDLSELFTFVYELNYMDEQKLKLNSFFSKLDDKTKKSFLDNKGTIYYIPYFKINDNFSKGVYQSSDITFDLKKSQHVNSVNDYENLVLNVFLNSKKDVIKDNLSSSESEEKSGISSLVGFIFIMFFLIIFLSIAISFASGAADDYEGYTYSNENHRSIHDTNTISARTLSRERTINPSQLLESRANIHLTIEEREREREREIQRNNNSISSNLGESLQDIRQDIEERRTNYEGYRNSLRERPSTTNLSSERTDFFRPNSRNYGSDLFVPENRDTSTRDEFLNRNRQRMQSEQFEELLAAIANIEEPNINTNNQQEPSHIPESVEKNTKRTISIEEESLKKEKEFTVNTKRQIYFDEEE